MTSDLFAAPEWVSIWYWLRTERKDFCVLPQQDPNKGAISMDEYERLRVEWAASGSPQITARQLANIV